MGTNGSISRPYTKDETRDLFLSNIHDVVRNFEKSEIKPTNKFGKLEGTFVVFSVLSLIESENSVGPSFSLIPTGVNGENIAGELHSCIGYTEEMFANIKKQRLFSRHKSAFVERMRVLLNSYNQNQISEGTNGLILEVLKTIDFGVDGDRIKMVANSSENQIRKRQLSGENYYPIDGFDIAGDLAERYAQLYMKRESPILNIGEDDFIK